MRDTIKIILKNILFILIIFILFEISVFNIELFKYYQIIKKVKPAGFTTKSIIKSSFKTHDFQCTQNLMRPVEKRGNKHSIVIFGCSYAYGTRLNDNQTFSYKLAKATDGKVFNRASPGWGAQQMLYQLRRDDFYKQIDHPDYIIYTFIGDHINRLNNYQWGGFWGNQVNLRYKNENGNLVEIKPLFKPIWSLFTVKEIQHFYENYLNSPSNYSKNIELFSLIMNESLKKAKEHYPNVKFVILIYDNNLNPKENVMFKSLKKQGFIILKTSDLVKVNLNDPIYHFYKDPHPNEKAWDVIVPGLVKKLNL